MRSTMLLATTLVLCGWAAVASACPGASAKSELPPAPAGSASS